MNFSLPSDITVQSQLLPDGKIYQFRHQTLGLLGRIVLRDRPGPHCHISSEIAGDPNDPMTERRAEIFQPLSEQLVVALEDALGIVSEQKGLLKPAFPTRDIPLSSPQELIESQQIPCDRCGAVAAQLIYADTAQTIGELEDCARKMYALYQELNVPTWIIGAPQGIPSENTPALVMQVWPQRQAAQSISPNAFTPLLDTLLAEHCR